MNKNYLCLGLMSGTSGDGIDTSVIKSDGKNQCELILDRYFEYNGQIQEDIHNLKDKIVNNPEKLDKFSKEIIALEKNITFFHAEAVNHIVSDFKENIDFLGFHGQTILHSPVHRATKQLGDGNLLSQLTKKKVIYNFRQNDLKNGGQGAPLTPIFHKLLKNKYKLKLPTIIMNIGGIANITIIDSGDCIHSRDIGPGNCMIDQWIRKNSKKKYDNKGDLAKSGKINKLILKNALEIFIKKSNLKSYDVKDFDSSFFKNLSLEDGAATLTEYTSEILYNQLKKSLPKSIENIFISGGGRKNKFLVKSIQDKINIPIKLIDDFGIDGDFIESQAFAYLGIRSFLKLPISFPDTTGCKEPCIGGEMIESY